jgi:hypothetical protein
MASRGLTAPERCPNVPGASPPGDLVRAFVADGHQVANVIAGSPPGPTWGKGWAAPGGPVS